MSKTTTSELLTTLDAFLTDINDQQKALEFYIALGKSKLFILLKYGMPVLKETEQGKYLQAYTAKPEQLLTSSELSTVSLGLERITQELKAADAMGVLLDEQTRNVKIPAQNIFQVNNLLQQAKQFKLKRLDTDKTLELENHIRRLVKRKPEITSAWLVGIKLTTASDYEYMLILEYSAETSATEKQETVVEIAESATPLLPDDQRLLIGSTEEVVGQVTIKEYAPFYIKRKF